MTIKFLKQWGFANPEPERDALQKLLDGGTPIIRNGTCVKIGDVTECLDIPGVFYLSTPGEAVKFAAALNKLRRPLHLIKQDLDWDWAARVKERDNNTCVLCGVQGDKVKASGKDVLTAHHWFKTKSRAGMARWSRACGVTVHFAEHIHTLHENPCWLDLDVVYNHVFKAEEHGADAMMVLKDLIALAPTESRVRALWLERCGKEGVTK